MSYDGGKGGAGVAQWIINHIPPHKHFISLFLGNCAVTRLKRPAEYSIGVELNPRVIGAYWQNHGIPCLIVRQGDAISFLDEAEAELDAETFIYADPPYLLSTRSAQRPLYAYEFSDIEQHRALLARLRSLPCMVAISGYWSELYELELVGWRVVTFNTVKRSGKPAVEHLWMNYGVPLELHDYRYLGKNFRERERIKRKKQRWTRRLRDMPALERYALLDALSAVRALAHGVPGGTATSGDTSGGIATNGDIDERSGIVRSSETRRHASPDVAVAAGIAGSDEGGHPRQRERGDPERIAESGGAGASPEMTSLQEER